MNTVIKNKLKEFIGKEVTLDSRYGLTSLHLPPIEYTIKYKVLRFEGEDCLVLGKENEEHYLSIDYINHISIKK